VGDDPSGPQELKVVKENPVWHTTFSLIEIFFSDARLSIESVLSVFNRFQEGFDFRCREHTCTSNEVQTKAPNKSEYTMQIQVASEESKCELCAFVCLALANAGIVRQSIRRTRKANGYSEKTSLEGISIR
jgi:hypothetical protein